MASVRQVNRPNKEGKKPWVVEYTDHTGKRRRATPSTGLKKDAEALRQKIERELFERTHSIASDSVSFADAADAWLRDCDRRRKIGARMTGNTLKGYENWTRIHAIPALGHIKMSSMEALPVQELIDIKSRDLAHNSLKSLLLCINQVVLFSVRKKWLRRNPLRDEPVQLPHNGRRKRIVPPTREEIMRIMQVLSRRRPNEPEHTRHMLMLLIVLGSFAGLRRGEIAGLQWENVDLDRRVIRVRHSLSRFDGLKEPKTAAGERDVPMSAIVYRMLDRYRASLSDPSGYVLRNRDGRHVYVERIVTRGAWCRLLKDAGVVKPDGSPKFSLHALRHAAISMLIEEGLDLFQVKHIAGHSRIATTADVYGHLMPESMRARLATDAVGGHFEGSPMIEPPPAPEPAPNSREEWERARHRALRLVDDGMPPIDVAAQLSISHAVIKKWQAGRSLALAATKASH